MPGSAAPLLGRPLATEEEIGERLSKRKALAIFSSDAISSSAYATEEILRVLVLAGAAALTFSLGVAIAIAIMLAVVSTSYRQIGYAYPNGGGAYAVGRANLGRYAALIAAAALLVDYIMTVAVSTSSGVEQITSALPSLAPRQRGDRPAWRSASSPSATSAASASRATSSPSPPTCSWAARC